MQLASLISAAVIVHPPKDLRPVVEAGGTAGLRHDPGAGLLQG